MKCLLPLASLLLMSGALPGSRATAPAPSAPNRPLASSFPPRCLVYVEATGLAPLFELVFVTDGGCEGADGDLAATTDFRALYAALEKDWMGLAPSTRVPPLDWNR